MIVLTTSDCEAARRVVLHQFNAKTVTAKDAITMYDVIDATRRRIESLAADFVMVDIRGRGVAVNESGVSRFYE